VILNLVHNHMGIILFAITIVFCKAINTVGSHRGNFVGVRGQIHRNGGSIWSGIYNKRFYQINCGQDMATFYFDVLENNYFFYWRIKMNH